jgi:hypothetical protein
MRPRYLGEVHKEGEEHPGKGIPHTEYFEDRWPWSSEMLLRVVKGLFVSAGGQVGGEVDRELEGLLRSGENKEVKPAGLKKATGWRHFGEVGEGGMYI